VVVSLTNFQDIFGISSELVLSLSQDLSLPCVFMEGCKLFSGERELNYRLQV
jgi:hypothetical protein